MNKIILRITTYSNIAAFPMKPCVPAIHLDWTTVFDIISYIMVGGGKIESNN